MSENKAIRALLIYNTLFVFAGGLLGPLYAIFAEGIGADIKTISFSLSVFMISATMGMIIIRKFGDQKYNKKNMLAVAYMIRAIAWLSFIFISSKSGLFFIQAILGIGEALGTPAYGALYAENLDKNKHMREFADRKILVNIGSAISVALGSLVVEKYGFNTLFICMSSIAMYCSISTFARPESFFKKDAEKGHKIRSTNKVYPTKD